MTGSIELDGDGRTLLIRFAYREDLVEQVKRMPGRRWDPRQKVWRVPTAQVDLVLDRFLQYGFEVAGEVSSLLAGTLAPAVAAAGSGAPSAVGQGKEPGPRANGGGLPFPVPAAALPPPAPDAMSVSALNDRVRRALNGAFPEPLWVVGEILDFDKGASRNGHAFFCLAEKRAGAAKPAATVQVALFATTAARLRARLELGDPPLTLRDGIEIRALVRIDMYAPQGRYQLIVEDVDPSFTLGKMALSRERILAELRQLGLDRRNAELPLPLPPLRVGVLTSCDSDGWHDFLQQLQGSGFGFEVTCFPVRVQGIDMRPTMLAGLRWFAARAADYDVLCLVRGGGSRSDLAWFDDRDLAFAVARHPLKVLCGIGHQRDQSVLDVIAHSEKTPTAVASALITAVQRAARELDGRARRLVDTLQRCLDTAARGLGRRGERLRRIVDRRLAEERNGLRYAGRRLVLACDHRLAAEQTRAAGASRRLQAAVRLPLRTTRDHLDAQARRLQLLDPVRVLGRGYAIVRGKGERILTDAAAVPLGQPVTIQFRDGAVVAVPHQRTPSAADHPDRDEPTA